MDRFIYIASGNQTWHAGKSTIRQFSSMIFSSNFSMAMFEDIKGYIPIYIP